MSCRRRPFGEARGYAQPATTAHRLNSDYAGATELAAWKKKVRTGWPHVRVEHVESSGVGDAPEVGDTMSVRAFVALGSLDPQDVDVQLVYGRSNGEDELLDTGIESLAVAESYDGGRHRFDVEHVLDRSGAFGYTVRVVPRNDLLVSPAELGVIALP